MENIGARVLVVDDEDALREMLDYGLHQAGFSVRTVPDGAEMLRVIAEWARRNDTQESSR